MGPVTCTLNVTTTDINFGKRKDPEFCPLARAVTRLFANTANLRILVTLTHIVVCDLKTKTPAPFKKYALPEEAIAFLEDFDAGWPVAPFTVEMEVPQR